MVMNTNFQEQFLSDPIQAQVLELLKRYRAGERNFNRVMVRNGNLYIAKPNLKGANLSHQVLSWSVMIGGNFSEANLRGVDLSKADLSDASFYKSDLREAIFSGTNLSRAYLRGANLARADLTGAQLIHANLSGANLKGAILLNADLTGANLHRTIMPDGTRHE